MLVVISDLHFEEVASDIIPASNGHPALGLDRNLPGAAFEQIFAELAADAERNGAASLDLVLAGDIFDLYRTQLWAHTDLRPYEACGALSAALETKLLEVLDAIAAESPVRESLDVFQRLAAGRFVRAVDGDRREEPFPVPVRLHYLPGNHDRLANGSTKLRAKVRSFLGLPPSDAPFDHVFDSQDPRVLVRHGHEYDRYNFAKDYASKAGEPLPDTFPASDYDASAFGDFITVDVAARLPFLFRAVHDDSKIVANEALRQVYRRLLEFDDVRPQSALVDFLLNIPGSGMDEHDIWAILQPVAIRLLDELAQSAVLKEWLDRLDHKWEPDLIDVFQALLASHVWSVGLPLKLLKPIASRLRGTTEGEQPEAFAGREPSIRAGARRFLVAGHTHQPQVATLATGDRFERYYVDTGTWRNQLRQGPPGRGFGRIKALTYVAVYGAREDPRGAQKSESFDYWSGLSQRF